MARKLFYSIGEVSRLVGEERSTLKFWEGEFPHLRPGTTPGGTRQYTERDIEAIRTVQRLLREDKLTIPGARAELQRRRTPLELREHTIARLEACLVKLRNLHTMLASKAQP